MATYETTAKAQQDLAKKLQTAASELKKIYDSTDSKDKARASELKSEIGKIQNQLMMTGGFGALGGGLAKGVTSLITAIPDLAIMGYDLVRSPSLGELVTGKQSTKLFSERMMPGVESVSQEQAGLFGVGKGVGSSLGFGKTMSALNVGANWFDEYMAGGTPMAQTALAVGSLAEAGRRGAYAWLQSRNAKKLLDTLPADEVKLLKDYIVKGQTSTDPLIAGQIAKLRADPKYAEIFNTLQTKAGEKILAGARQEVNPNYPVSGAGKDVFKSVDFEVTNYKDKIKTVAEDLYKKAAKLSSDTPMVNTGNTQNAIAEQIKTLSRSELNDSKAAVRFLEGLQQELTVNPKMTVPQFQTWVTDFGRKARGNESLVSEVSVGTQKVISSAIFGGLKDDLRLMGTSTDKTERAVSNLLQTASTKTKDAVDKYETFIADGLPAAFKNKVIAQMSTEDVLNTISGIKDPAVKAKTLALIKNTEPDAFRLVQQRTFDDFMTSVKAGAGETTGKIDLKALANRWSGLNASEKDNLAISMGTTVKDFDERIGEVDKFFRYGQQFAGEQAAAKINPSEASQLGFAATGGSYTGGKVAGLAANLWNSAKGGLNNDQVMNILLAPETKGIMKEVITNPNSVKTLETIDKAMTTRILPPVLAAGREAVLSTDQQMSKPAPVDTSVNPITGSADMLNLEGIDLTPAKPEGGLDLEGIKFGPQSKIDMNNPIAKQIRAEAEKQGYGEFADLFVRQAYQESGFNPKAVSPKGAVGIFQHMPATAKELGIDPTDPNQSIQGGVKYMGQLLNQYKKDPVQALAAYNWGMGNLNKQGLDAAPPETQKYLETILAGT
jgi:hypothetical protein